MDTILQVGVTLGAARFAYKQANDQHIESKEDNRRTNDIGINSDILMTLLQADSDITSMRSEAERDSYDQKNQQLQTLIISSSVMIGALISIFIQGILPEGTNYLITAFFGLTNGLSFAVLFIAIIYCLEISKTASDFMFKRSKKGKEVSTDCHKAHLGFYRDYRGPEEGDDVMYLDTGKTDVGQCATEQGRRGNITHDYGNNTYDIELTSGGIKLCGVNSEKIQLKGELWDFSRDGGRSNPTPRLNSNHHLLRVDPTSGDWHFSLMKQLKRAADKIFEANHKMYRYSVDTTGDDISFEFYWEENCNSDFIWANRLFYMGSFFLLAACMLWALAQFQIKYNR